MKLPSTYETEIDFGALGEHKCVILYDFTPGTSGRTYGPPEDCYPPEDPEVDILSIKAEGITFTFQVSDIQEYVLDDLATNIIEHETQLAEESQYEAACDAAEDAARWEDYQ